MATTADKHLPVLPLARIGFITALVAVLFSAYGSHWAEWHISTSPMAVARVADPDQRGLPATRTSNAARYTLQLVSYVLPFVLGVVAALIGGTAMTRIEKANGQYSGNVRAVFSIFIGGLASVISGCMILSVYIWPRLPSIYTQ